MADHPIITAAQTADSNVTPGGITETLLTAEVARNALVLGATETLGDYDFSTGGVPLAVIYGKTGYVYFYNADDTTTPDDGSTCLVTGDGRRYMVGDSSAIAIASVLAIENDPPGSPSEGDAYIVDTAPTGAWVAHAKDVALYTARGWVFATPKIGQALLNQDTGANVQYSVAGTWGPMATALDVDAVTPDLLQFPGGLSVEAQQNAPPVSITAGLHYLVGTAGSGAWSGHDNDIAYSADGTNWSFIDAYGGFTVFNKASNSYLTWFDTEGVWKAPWPYQATCQGRLTLESGVPISTSDQTAKATLYFTPFDGNAISLYVNGGWVLRTFTQRSLSLSGFTASRCYDIFAYDNAGTVTLESLIWTNATTRATAIALQDGIPVKSGDATRRLIGTIYTSATGQCTDSLEFRYVSNLYNRRARPMCRQDTQNTWTTGTTSYRQARAQAANQLDFVNCLDRDMVTAVYNAAAHGNGATSPQAMTAIGLDSTTTPAAQCTTSAQEILATSTNQSQMVSTFAGYAGVGKHALVMLESATVVSGNVTFIGDNGGSTQQTGITGTVIG